MAAFNRRQWLKTAGAAGAFAFLGSAEALAHPGPALTDVLLPPQGPVRLSLNENPYGPSQKVKQAISDAFSDMYRYPYDLMPEVVGMLAQKHGVPADHIVLTVGSGEGLKAAGLAYGQHGNEIIAAQPTFLALMDYARVFGAYIHDVPLDKDLVHDLDAMERRITQRTSLIFVCNPNNPTGTILSAERMRDFCSRISERTVVFADEAYFDYINEPNYPSMVELVKQGMNVIVSRTFSKIYGMAGIRVGYLIARPDIAKRLRDHTMASVSIPALAAAKAALSDTDFRDFSLRKNAEALDIIYKTLDEMNLRYVRSHANFVFFDSKRNIQEVNTLMQEKGFLVGRPFPPLNTWCRVSTGKTDDIKNFAKALKELA
jgi:histidinol-phosphate aminotransferase